MSTQVFVPITDDIIYNHPEQIEGPLVPYFAGMECHNWLTIEINPDETEPVATTEAVKSGVRLENPGLHLAYSA
ncbi:MAG: hypothetical protein AAF431_16855 [Pseudomonadota bacterium]